MTRPKTDIEPRIVHAARARFLEEGVDGASLRSIARDAGTSIGMIYYYFPTKDDLFLAVVEEVYARLVKDLGRELAPGGGVGVEDRLRRGFRRLSQMSDDEVTVIRLIVREGLVSSSRLGKLVERFSRGHIALIFATLAEGVGAGQITTRHHPAVLMVATFAIAIGAQMVLRVVGEGFPVPGVPKRERLAEQLADVLFNGIRAKEGE
jgi:AcrR family transcriptional regulator